MISPDAMKEFQAVKEALHALRAGTRTPHAFSDEARRATALLQALPAPYPEVLLQLLDRLESSALFSEESCSFSQSGLLDNLQTWLDKAQARLDQVRAQQA
jgi:hypothetical protein